MLSGRSRTANLFRRPFVEGSVGGGFINNGADDWGWSAEAEVQGYLPTPIPWSFYGKFSADQLGRLPHPIPTEGFVDPTSQFNLEFKNIIGTGYITAKPTPYDRVVAYVDTNAVEPNLLDGVQVPRFRRSLDMPPHSARSTGTAPRRHLRPNGRTTTPQRRASAGATHSAIAMSSTRRCSPAASDRANDESGVLLFDTALLGTFGGAQTIEYRARAAKLGWAPSITLMALAT